MQQWLRGPFALEAIDVSGCTKAYLLGSSLPHAAVVGRGLGTAM